MCIDFIYYQGVSSKQLMLDKKLFVLTLGVKRRSVYWVAEVALAFLQKQAANVLKVRKVVFSKEKRRRDRRLEHILFSFRFNIVADILSRVTLCRKFAWLRYL